MVRTLLRAAALCACATALHAQARDTAGVVTAAQTIIRAISTKDTALARTVLLPGALFVSTVDMAEGASQARTQTDADFYSGLPRQPEVLLERIWSPAVKFFGYTLAEVAAPYDFHMDGKFSHCGTDVFTVVRTNRGWRVASIAYTIQLTGCAPSPLGSPKR